ncbi:DEAD/DEAH box helicase [Neorhodopirellula pilleata]|uniref:ATP-dependent helicase HepA n=1 Tax=Neorhodopirellula pilleata TaxID=2714738 RepID=A0A5C6AQJ2_9BACT|nr:DEAD/DEAH box helicase [Neorhodopirellula pilleata]TWU01990.1 ATP-dependent helicase HepA [Neorhodopirellula pilleata]
MARKQRPTLPNRSPKQSLAIMNAIAKLRANREKIEDDEDDLFESPAFKLLASSVKPNRALEWARKFEAILYQVPDELFDAVDASFKCEVSAIYDSGEIHGTCLHGGRVYPVFARQTFEPTPSGCACSTSGGERPCIHNAAFLSFLRRQLFGAQTSLHQDINQGRFSSGQPNYDRYRPDPVQELFGDLDQCIEKLERVGVDGNDDTLAPRANQSDQRLAWRLEMKNNRIEFYPIVQQPKKRGGGYTKGRRLTLEDAAQDSTLRKTPQDLRVLGCIRYSDSYHRYRPEATLNVFDAVERLIGADNVFNDTEPWTIRRDSMEFELIEVSDHYCVLNHLAGSDESVKEFDRDLLIRRVSDPEFARATPQNKFMAHDARGPILRLEMQRHLIGLIDASPGMAEPIFKLSQLRPVPKAQGPELARRLNSLQNQISVKVPEELLGPSVPASVTHVVLLRSNADGTLDVALRVRDATGRLRKPGTGPAFAPETRDGKSIQVCRNLRGEVRHAESIAERFHFQEQSDHESLIGEHFAAHISNFTDALDLIDRLQTFNREDTPESERLEILWDRNSEKPVSVLGSISSNNVRVEVQKKRDWFGVTGQCEVGGKQIELNDLLENLSGDDAERIHGDFVRLKDGQWARISEKLRRRLRSIRDATHSDRKTLKLDATSAPAMRDIMADGEIQLKATKAWQDCLKRLARAEKLVPKVPDSLDATLRDYQIEGFQWLRRLAEWGVGGVLADDMGLGKTLQTLAVVLDRKDEGPTLVIAPTSVGFNWVREANRFAPELNVHLYRETDRKEFLSTVGPGDLVVCSYGLALRDEQELSSVEWGTLVLDEAQAIKNSRSKTSRAIADIPAKWKVALTGTPVENHLGELWSLFHVVSPGVFGGWESFRKRFAAPIELKDSQIARESLAERLKPFVLRRKKSEVLKDLPPRTEMNLYVDLSDSERAEYEKIRLQAIGEIEEVEAITTTQDQRFRILAMLTRLRQISCNAALVNRNFKGESAKLQQLIETMTGLKEEGHRALIFSQFTEHLGLIRAELEAKGFTYEYLDGSTPAKARQERVDAFQNGAADVFLISLKAGGTGLNLTAADYVIHMDPWWNPAVEDQATDRAHRIGQDKPVMVYRIIARGTIEEEILALHESKRDLVAGIMEGTTAAGKLSNEELIAMLKRG